MILFCDTSALVKLYIAEDASREMRELAGRAAVVAVCRIAWAEMMAAVARRTRELPGDAQAMETVRKRLSADWPHYAVVELTQAIVELAGEYADTFALRAYDSVQLAAACKSWRAKRFNLPASTLGFAKRREPWAWQASPDGPAQVAGGACRRRRRVLL